MTEQRKEELRSLFWSETDDSQTQEWRNELTAEERELVNQWEQEYDTAIEELSKKIVNNEAGADNREPIQTEKKQGKPDAYNRYLGELQSDLMSSPEWTKLDRENGIKAIVILHSPQIREQLEKMGIQIKQFDIRQLTILADLLQNGLIIYSDGAVLTSGVTPEEIRQIVNPRFSPKEMLRIRNQLIREHKKQGLFFNPAAIAMPDPNVLEQLENRPKIEEMPEQEPPQEDGDPEPGHKDTGNEQTARLSEAEATERKIAVTEQRKEELRSLYWSETNDPETQEWRDELTAEERQVVEEWDREYEKAIEQMVKKILNNNVPADNREPLQKDGDQEKVYTFGPRYNPQLHPDKKRNFTRDQLERAKQVDLLGYISSRYEVQRHGNRNYRLKEHESLVIFPDTNSWYWYSQKEGGNALDFLVKYESKNLVDAVYELLGETFDPQSMYRRERQQAEEQQPVSLPNKADTSKHVFAYLTKTRGLDPAVVNGCLNDGSIYEGVNVVKRPGKDLTFYNCVFVGRDTEGNPAWAHQRSVSEKMTFRGDAEHSRKEYAFRLEARERSNWVNVFEAPIDAMSYATLQKRGGMDYGLEHHISLGGVNDLALQTFLETHPEVDTINLCLDNDQPGRMASAAIAQKYQDQGYTVLESCPEHKDYNDDLKAELAADNQPVIDLPEKAQDNRRVFAHLAKEAAINPDLLNRYMTQGILYQTEQTVERDGQVKRYASAVYLGRDEDGNPDYAMRVSLYRSPENGYFKMEYKDPVEGGCISLPGENSSLLVFNNPVSMLTQQSMMLEAGKENKNHYLCALTGLPGEVERYVQKHPQINEVKLMLDKTVGISRKTNQPVDYRELTVRKIKDSLQSRKIDVVAKCPRTTDLNLDYLKSRGLAKGNSSQKAPDQGKELEK